MSEVEFYKKNWWMYLVSGLVTLAFGFVTVVNPAQTLLTLGFFFGLYLLVNGVIDMIVGISSGRSRDTWLLSLIFGALQALIGVYILQRPGLSLATFVMFAAFGLVVRGAEHAVEAFDASYDAVYRTWQVIAAVASVFTATLIWRYPVTGTLAFVWVLGAYALITGPLMIAFAMEAKNGFAVAKKKK
jgi:uncharacterized membrane protein HdeD (DUF308 family)